MSSFPVLIEKGKQVEILKDLIRMVNKCCQVLGKILGFNSKTRAGIWNLNLGKEINQQLTPLVRCHSGNKPHNKYRAGQLNSPEFWFGGRFSGEVTVCLLSHHLLDTSSVPGNVIRVGATMKKGPYSCRFQSKLTPEGRAKRSRNEPHFPSKQKPVCRGFRVVNKCRGWKVNSGEAWPSRRVTLTQWVAFPSWLSNAV